MKRCSRCGDSKELSLFNKDKRRKDGVQSICRDCKISISRAYYKSNSKKMAEQSRLWRKQNPEKRKQLARDWKKKTGYSKKHREKYHDEVMDYDSHYKKILVKMGFENPTKELIDLKRTQIKIIRLCRTMTDQPKP